MHLLGGVEDPRDVPRGMFKLLGRDENKLRAAVLNVAARLFNFRHWDGGWRATLPLLQEGDVDIACSVLYRPFSEMDLDEPYGAPPESAYFGKLIELLEASERRIEAAGHTVVRSADDLRGDGLKFVHCVEGGFHLGSTPDEVDANVRELARRGVL